VGIPPHLPAGATALSLVWWHWCLQAVSVCAWLVSAWLVSAWLVTSDDASGFADQPRRCRTGRSNGVSAGQVEFRLQRAKRIQTQYRPR
jgi:hypothetical protein